MNTEDQFVVNIVRPGTASVRRTVHRSSCRYAGLSRRSYLADVIEVHRLLESKARGIDRDTQFCLYCEPIEDASLLD